SLPKIPLNRPSSNCLKPWGIPISTPPIWTGRTIPARCWLTAWGQPAAGEPGLAGGSHRRGGGQAERPGQREPVTEEPGLYRLAAKRRYGEVCAGRGRAVGDRAAGGL